MGMIIVAILTVLAVGLLIGLIAVGRAWAWGPFKFLFKGYDEEAAAIVQKYDAGTRSGEIVFYGASNFRLWNDMEADFPGFLVQNHGFGGSDDQNLMDFADRLLYPYQPKIVVFQTGSNDYVAAKGSNAEKIRFCMERKARMFDTFHEKLPDAHFVVMSGLLLPGRSQYIDMTLEVNRQLRELCESREYLTYVDAEALIYQNGIADLSLFVEDGIHLTDEARVVWANEYIIPALQELAAQMGDDAETVLK